MKSVTQIRHVCSTFALHTAPEKKKRRKTKLLHSYNLKITKLYSLTIVQCWSFQLILLKFFSNSTLKYVRDWSAIIECKVKLKFGDKILPAYSLLDVKLKQQLQSGENAVKSCGIQRPGAV